MVVASGFDLHTPEALAGVEDEVVAFAIAPGLGDAEADRRLQRQHLMSQLPSVGGHLGGLVGVDECSAHRSLGRGNPSPRQH